MTVLIRRLGLPAVAILALVLAPACAKKYAAESDGQDVGEAVCDVRDADADEVEQARADLLEELEDLDENYAAFTAEDRADIAENLDDLVQHVTGDDDILAQQDLAVIQRSLDNVRDDVSDTAQATIDGILQGLDDCLNT